MAGELREKQRVFVEEYLSCWNASEAARRAGYNGQSNVVGPRLLADVRIKAIIRQRLDEKQLTADEVLVRLAEHARADYAIYIQHDGTVDIAQMIADGKAHLIKGTKWDAKNNMVVEFYDAQAALVQIGKHHSLFADRVASAADDELAELLREWRSGKDSGTNQALNSD